jgi:hypothetical protein
VRWPTALSRARMRWKLPPQPNLTLHIVAIHAKHAAPVLRQAGSVKMERNAHSTQRLKCWTIFCSRSRKPYDVAIQAYFDNAVCQRSWIFEWVPIAHHGLEAVMGYNMLLFHLTWMLNVRVVRLRVCPSSWKLIFWPSSVMCAVYWMIELLIDRVIAQSLLYWQNVQLLFSSFLRNAIALARLLQSHGKENFKSTVLSLWNGRLHIYKC